MKLHSLLIPALAATMFTACGYEPGDTTEKVTDEMRDARRDMAEADDARAWMKERDAAVNDLSSLRQRLVDRRTRIQEKLDKGVDKADKRAEFQGQVAELDANIARLDREIPRLANATTNDWDQVRRDTRSLRDSTTNWFDRQLEKLD